MLVLASLLVPAVMPSPADAVSINISIGTSLNTGRAISCSEGARRIRDRGFRDVRNVDCRGRYFVYRARRGRDRYEIAVSRRNGRVVDFRRIGRR
jgi:hypothetical protein